ncbi:hypothetical protein [Chitinophaga sp. Cy-1792]|uniref:hypothetical protein n=1 Tax=Chitinophaga sp. Cy-1792 TaxID=2608339 RepID=UPI00142071CD|nr:hypothetical protein [Chitinophaga sp. Cy-1792]NIG53871.1 hypothetical protein [Chitinophaga sp. Cy-1792]
MNFLKRKNTTGDKTYYYYDFGRGKGQRPATGILVYMKPKDQTQKNNNKQALALLEVKKSQAIIEQQSISTAFIPAHKFKDNFLYYYEDYVNTNKRDGNRHLESSMKPPTLHLSRSAQQFTVEAEVTCLKKILWLSTAVGHIKNLKYLVVQCRSGWRFFLYTRRASRR